MAIEHYDSDGKLIGSSVYKDEWTVGAKIGMAFIILAVLGWIWEIVTDWRSIEPPYRYVAAYYNYLIAEPLKVIPTIWTWISAQNITPYPNLNLIISGVGVCSGQSFLANELKVFQ